MKITSLLENTTCRDDMHIEHGLSLYIETAHHKILFDMGQTDLFVQNAKNLGISLAGADYAVLSHGHYDHGGGLSAFLALNDRAPVFVHRDAFLPHYNGTQKYIGLDTSLSSHPRLIFTGDEHRIADGLTLYSCNDRERARSSGEIPDFGAGGLTERVGDTFIDDDFRHEQYLLIEDGGRRVLISGCSHKGICGIVSWFSPDVLVGGFHVSKLPLDETLSDAARFLDTYPTEFYTCHCTGEQQYAFMRQFLPHLHYLACGDTIVV